jgi:hypothetical protein
MAVWALMSIVLVGRRLTDHQLAWVLAHPSDAGLVLLEEAGDGGDLVEDGTQLDLNKTWACINFLLTGSRYVDTLGVGAALFGGEPVDDEDDDDGIRLMRSEDVAATARHLEAISADDLRNRYDPQLLHELSIYPSGWDWNEGDLAWVLAKFEELVSFYRDAAQHHQAVLLCLL